MNLSVSCGGALLVWLGIYYGLHGSFVIMSVSHLGYRQNELNYDVFLLLQMLQQGAKE